MTMTQMFLVPAALVVVAGLSWGVGRYGALDGRAKPGAESAAGPPHCAEGERDAVLGRRGAADLFLVHPGLPGQGPAEARPVVIEKEPEDVLWFETRPRSVLRPSVQQDGCGTLVVTLAERSVRVVRTEGLEGGSLSVKQGPVWVLGEHPLSWNPESSDLVVFPALGPRVSGVRIAGGDVLWFEEHEEILSSEVMGWRMGKGLRLSAGRETADVVGWDSLLQLTNAGNLVSTGLIWRIALDPGRSGSAAQEMAARPGIY